MLRGWLLVNRFIQTDKFNDLYTILETAFSRDGIVLERRTNSDILAELGGRCVSAEDTPSSGTPSSGISSSGISSSARPDFVLFWDKDVRLAEYLELQGVRCFNPARTIELCDDKSLTAVYLERFGIPQPKTVIAPKTYAPRYGNYDFLDSVVGKLGFPLVIKECFGSFGQQVYRADTYDQIIQRLDVIGTVPILFQEFVHTSAGRDVRIQVVGNRVSAAVERLAADGDFRANVSNGGKMKPYQPTDLQAELAVKVCRLMKADFAGVDLLWGTNDQPLVCEVNSNAHIRNIADCTGVNVALDIVNHVKEVMQ